MKTNVKYAYVYGVDHIREKHIQALWASLCFAEISYKRDVIKLIKWRQLLDPDIHISWM